MAVCRDQRSGLRFQALCHAVEGICKRADFVMILRVWHTRRQVAGRNSARRVHQFAHRLHEPVCYCQRDPDRNADQHQRAEEQRDIELELELAGACREVIIVGQNRLRPLHLAEGRNVSIPGCIEEHVAFGVEEDNRLDLVRLGLHDHAFPCLQSADHVRAYDVLRLTTFRIDGCSSARNAVLADLNNR